MFYIKIDKNKDPVGNPLLWDTLEMLLGVSVSEITDEILSKEGYAVFQHSRSDATLGHCVETTEYFMDTDGIVRNKIDITPYSQEELMDICVKTPRRARLATCDWTQTIDAPLTTAQKAAWATYRQALRDLPTQYPNVKKPEEVVWPVDPDRQAESVASTTGTAST